MKKKPKREDNHPPKLVSIDIQTYKVAEKAISLKEDRCWFQFSNSAYFHPDNNTKEVAHRCFEWLFNPLSF